MKGQRKLVTATLTAVLSVGFVVTALTQTAKPTQDELLAEGKQLYERYCAVCHGKEGKGDGDVAYLLFPKPRDLSQGVFKIRTTPTGSLPTDNDLYKTISNGMAGTAMPPWKDTLTNRQRWAVMLYVKSLSERFKEEQPQPPLRIGAPPKVTPQLLALGKQVYQEQKCWECHGHKGKGDGPSAPTLKDDWDFPIKPYDFTQPARFKGGSTPQDIYRTFMTGMNGTPMPSYEGTISEKRAWALTYYTLSLVEKKPVLPRTGHTLIAERVPGSLPVDDPLNAAWAQAKPLSVPLQVLWDRDKTVETLSVRALHNGKEIAFLLEWDDPLPSTGFLRHEDFRDACAIQFPLNGGNGRNPFFGMGDNKEAGAVNIWHWKADWELDVQRFRDIESIYPNVAADGYPQQKVKPGEVHRVVEETGDVTFLSGWAADNLFSIPFRLSPIEDANAIGPGTITSQKPEQQSVRGRGLWFDGKWHVVFVRSLTTDEQSDVQFEVGTKLPIAFAVWDGGAGDRDGQKMVTAWQTVEIRR